MLQCRLQNLSFFLLLGLTLSGGLTAGPTHAQIRPDATLANPTVTQRQGNTVVITGGTRAGANLFHSFREFSIPEGGTASFRDINPTVSHVISRITGSSVSRINGTLEGLQPNGSISSANFFLINPNGIVFGPNASLNIGGSFLATTAERLLFENGLEFSAVAPHSPPLLTVTTPIGLQFGSSPAPIRNASIAPLIDTTTGEIVFDSDFGEPFIGGLQVPPGKTLALVGGAIAFPGGVVTVEGGRVELGSVGAAGVVRLTSTRRGWQLGYEDISTFQNLLFSEFAVVGTNGEGAGSIQIQGRQVTLIEEAALIADTLGNQTGGEIYIRASELTLDDLSSIGSASDGSGRTADIRIASDRLTVQNGSFIAITTFRSGPGGDLTITARETIELSGGLVLLTETGEEEWGASGLFNQVSDSENLGVTGKGGNIIVTTPVLRLLDGAQISTDTFAVGDAGNIRIRTAIAELDGVALDERGQVFAPEGLPFGSGVFAGTGLGSTGAGGTIRLVADRVRLRNGAVLQTTTFGDGDAGDLFIRASDVIDIRGTDAAGLFPTSLIAASGGIPDVVARGFPEATGRGGTLQLQTGELRVMDGAAIAVGSLNPDERVAQGGGNADIRANLVYLLNQGRILTETASGDGGDMSLSVRDVLILRDTSQISTSAGREFAGGDGGNISMESGYIAAAFSENSDITANAYTGAGGNITITTSGLFGIAPRTFLTHQSDITASSDLGVNGTIQINSPNVDPNRGTAALPSTPVNPQLDQRCQSGQNVATSRFVETGRGGLPLTPENVGHGSGLWEDWRSPIEANLEQLDSPSHSFVPSSPLPSPIVEAQGWEMSQQGEVMLIAASSTVTPYSSWQTPDICRN